MPSIFLMIGAPGSGKSFVARLISECEPAHCICPDELHQERTNLSKARILALAYERLSAVVQRGESVILDSTAAHTVYRQRCSAQARRLGAHLIGVYLKTPAELCIARHRRRIPLPCQAQLTPHLIRSCCNELVARPPQWSRLERYYELVTITPEDDPMSLLNLSPPLTK